MNPPITAITISARMGEIARRREFPAPAAAPDCGAGDANTAASPDVIGAVIGRPDALGGHARQVYGQVARLSHRR
jgi:hypothetical protein